MRIFLAEDNLGDVFLLEEALRRQSLICELDHYVTAEDAIRAAIGDWKKKQEATQPVAAEAK